MYHPFVGAGTPAFIQAQQAISHGQQVPYGVWMSLSSSEQAQIAKLNAQATAAAAQAKSAAASAAAARAAAVNARSVATAIPATRLTWNRYQGPMNGPATPQSLPASNNPYQPTFLGSNLLQGGSAAPRILVLNTQQFTLPPGGSRALVAQVPQGLGSYKPVRFIVPSSLASNGALQVDGIWIGSRNQLSQPLNAVNFSEVAGAHVDFDTVQPGIILAVQFTNLSGSNATAAGSFQVQPLG